MPHGAAGVYPDSVGAPGDFLFGFPGPVTEETGSQRDAKTTPLKWDAGKTLKTADLPLK